MSKKYLLSGVALMSLSLLAGLGISEIALRLYGIDPSMDRLARYQFDDTLGWVTKKRFKYYRSSIRYGHFCYYGPDGFPTTKTDFNTPSSPRARSIAVIGDSFAEGYYASSYEASFPYLLGTYLAEYQILNLGVSGYSPDQYLLRARRELPRFPNTRMIVVMLFPFNDLPDLNKAEYQGYSKPYFGDTLDNPVNTPLTAVHVSEPGGRWSRTLRNTALYAVLRPLVRRPVEVRMLEALRHPAVNDERLLNKALRIIKQIALENPQAELLVYRVSHHREYEAPDVFHTDIELYRQQCARLHLWCADMEPLLSSVTNHRDLYLKGDWHFSELGSLRVAQQLRDLLLVGHPSNGH